jgi:hypothetical protein
MALASGGFRGRRAAVDRAGRRRPLDATGVATRLLGACALLALSGMLALSAPTASAAPPAPFDACSTQSLPAPAANGAADSIIVDGQMTAAGQEAYYAAPNSSGGLANANTTVAFRSVVDPIPLTGLYGYSGSAYGDSSTFSYAGETPGSSWPTGPGVGSIDRNWQLQYWQGNGYSFYYTAASSDFVTNGQPLFVGECAGDGALRLSGDDGLSLHEIVADLAAGAGWNWTQAAADITASEWDEINYWVELAKALNKKVIWSEPAQGWEALAQNATANSYFAQWGDTLVPMFASDFEAPQTGHLMGEARYWAATVAQSYGMPLGESIQSWYFRQQPDLAAQVAAGLPTPGATGDGTQSSPAQPPCCELDPLNTNAYARAGSNYGDPLNNTYTGEEPSLAPTPAATQALAEYGGAQGATYYEVEGVNGVYGVGAGIAGEGPVDDMAWTAPGVANASTYLQGIEQFSSGQLASGPMATSTIPTAPLFQLWNPTQISHYYTTQTNSAGIPLNPSGNAAPNCASNPSSNVYCYQETPLGAAPIPAGYVATSSAAGTVALYEYVNAGKHEYYYSPSQSSAPSGYALAGDVSGLGSGIVGYVTAAQTAGTEPFYWMSESGYDGRTDYFYTTDAAARATALESFFDYDDLGVNCWLFTAPGLAPGAGVKLTFATPPPTTAPAGATFSIVVDEDDPGGNVIASDSTTALALAASGGGFSCATTPTELTDGSATFSGCSFTTTSTSPYTLTASSDWLVPAAAATTVSPPPTQLVYEQAPPSSVAAAATFSVVVDEDDAHGNLVSSDSTTTLSLVASGGGFSCTTTPAQLTDGEATFSGCSFTAASATPYTLEASSPSLPTVVADTTVTPGQAAKLVYEIAPPSSVQAGSALVVVVAEEDAEGNVELGDSSTPVGLAASGGGFACATAPTHLSAGVATFSGCSFTMSSPSPFTVTATSPSLTPAVSALTVLPVTPASAASSEPTIGTLDIGRASVSGTVVSWLVSCAGAGGSTCTATASITVLETLRGRKVTGVVASARPPIRRRVVTIGTATITLAGGNIETLRVKLTRLGRRLLAARRSLAVKLTLTSGNAEISSTTLTLRAESSRNRAHHA